MATLFPTLTQVIFKPIGATSKLSLGSFGKASGSKKPPYGATLHSQLARRFSDRNALFVKIDDLIVTLQSSLSASFAQLPGTSRDWRAG